MYNIHVYLYVQNFKTWQYPVLNWESWYKKTHLIIIIIVKYWKPSCTASCCWISGLHSYEYTLQYFTKIFILKTSWHHKHNLWICTKHPNIPYWSIFYKYCFGESGWQREEEWKVRQTEQDATKGAEEEWTRQRDSYCWKAPPISLSWWSEAQEKQKTLKFLEVSKIIWKTDHLGKKDQ